MITPPFVQHGVLVRVAVQDFVDASATCSQDHRRIPALNSQMDDVAVGRHARSRTAHGCVTDQSPTVTSITHSITQATC